MSDALTGTGAWTRYPSLICEQLRTTLQRSGDTGVIGRVALLAPWLQCVRAAARAAGQVGVARDRSGVRHDVTAA